jgi:hypothetical protein
MASKHKRLEPEQFPTMKPYKHITTTDFAVFNYKQRNKITGNTPTFIH